MKKPVKVVLGDVAVGNNVNVSAKYLYTTGVHTKRAYF